MIGVSRENLHLKKFLHYHYPGILWVVLILVLTCIPGTLIPEVTTYLDLFKPDKLVHLFLFAILVILFLRGFKKQFPGEANRFSVSITLNIGIFLGGITELLQGTTLVTGRLSSIYDFIANVAGCFLGWWIFVLWKKKQE